MIKRSKLIFSLLLENIKTTLQRKKIFMSESGRSRASAHELQLIDGGYYQKRILIKQRGVLHNNNINFIHK